MKKNIILLSIIAGLIIIISSCKKDKTHLLGVQPTTSAFLKVVHAAPSFRKIFNMPDSFNIIVGTDNDQRLFAGTPNSATTPLTVPATPFTYNSAFPTNTTNVNTYAAIPAGSQNIRLV